MAPVRRSRSFLLLLSAASLSCHFGLSAPEPGAGIRHPEVRRTASTLSRHRTGLLRREVQGLAEAIVAEAEQADLSPAFVLAVIQVESGGYNFALSHRGAVGLMQLLPGTGEDLARRLGVPWRGPATLFDPQVNVRLGVAYLRQLLDRFGGDVEMALAAYNWGPTRIAARARRGDALPRAYARRVLRALARFESTSGRRAPESA